MSAAGPQLVEASPNDHSQPGRSGTGRSQAADHEDEKGTVASVVGPAVSASFQMKSERRRLFRGKLVVQIFPQPLGDLGTFH
jgi:hypothetical protein